MNLQCQFNPFYKLKIKKDIINVLYFKTKQNKTKK